MTRRFEVIRLVNGSDRAPKNRALVAKECRDHLGGSRQCLMGGAPHNAAHIVHHIAGAAGC